MDGQSTQFLTYLLPLAIIVLVVRRNLRPRRLRIERLWITPALIVLVAILAIAGRPPTGLAVWIALPLALGLGGLAGWLRGRFTTITVDPECHELTSKASALGLILIAGLFVVRYALRAYLEQDLSSAGGRLNAYAAPLTDGLLLFTVGLIAAQRLEMWLRARRLLAEAIAAKAARPVSSITP